MTRARRLACAAFVLAVSLTGCSSEPERADLVVLVNPAYPKATFDVAHPKADDALTCDLYTAEDATAIVDTPALPTVIGGYGCNYFGPRGRVSVGTLSTEIDEISISSKLGARATIGGNSAWVLDLGPADSCYVDVALNFEYSLSIDAHGIVFCEDLVAAAEKILARMPDDPAATPRVIPELDRYRVVLDPNDRGERTISGQFPPQGTIITTLDDPRYLHPDNVGPAR